MTISKIEDNSILRNSSVAVAILAALTTFIWPIHLARDRAFAAVNPNFTVKPNITSDKGSLVERKVSVQTHDISFHYRGQTYRAQHTIQQWSPKTHTWHNVTGNITENQNRMADGYQLDHITAVATGDTWYAGTLVGSVVVGRPSSGWKSSSNGLPERTVTAIAELSTDSQIAAVGYGGYSSATPQHIGHVYVTLDGGTRWFDISTNLPDKPIAALKFGNTKANWALEAKIGTTWYQTTQHGKWTAEQ